MNTASRSNRQFLKPQFSFRLLFVVVTVICVAFGVYMANRSVTFAVPAVMPLDKDDGVRVATITEHRSYWYADEIRLNAKAERLRLKIAYGLPSPRSVTPGIELARVEFMLEDLTNIYHRSERDLKLIDQYPAEFRKVAKEGVAAPQHFSHAATAAAVLARLGDSSQLGRVVDLYKANGALAPELYDLCICFSKKQTAAEQKFIQALKDQIEIDGCSEQHRQTFAEQLSDIDPKLYESVQFEFAAEAQILAIRSDSIVWLLENRASDQVFEIAMDYLSDSNVQQEYYNCVEVLSAVLKSDWFANCDRTSQERFVELAERLGTLHYQCFSEIANHGGKLFEPFMRESISNPEGRFELESAVLAAKSWTDESEYRALLRAALSKSKHAVTIFDLCVECFGVEETIRILKERWKSDKAHWIFNRICENTPLDQGQEMGSLLSEAFEVSLKPDPDVFEFQSEIQRFEVLAFARKFGFGDLAKKFARRIPEIDDYWFEDSDGAIEFMVWFNENFELEQPLTVIDVIKSKAGYEYSVRESQGAFRIRKFKLAALQAAGFGFIVDPENFGFDGSLFERICELTGDSLKVECHDMDDRYRVRLLVAPYVYEFQMSNRWSWYENAPACDALNAILERRGIEERFFVFQHAYGNSYVRFVMFAKPSKMKLFLETHDEFKVEDGCEQYWE